MASQNVNPEAPKAPRHRSPNYPGISLKAAVEKITVWFKADGLVASPTDAAMKHMKGDYGRVISALKNFGLISEESGRIKLTQRGVDIVVRTAEDPKRKQALTEAALSPGIYRELLKEYPGGLPSDTTLQSELIAGKKFNPKFVTDFIADLRATLEFAGILPLAIVDSDEEGEKPNENAHIRVGDYVQWESNGQIQFAEPKRIRELSDDGQWAFLEGSNTGLPINELNLIETPPTKSAAAHQAQPPRPRTMAEAQQMFGVVPLKAGTRQDVFSLDEGTVRIEWPEPLSAESFEDLRDWLDILKRKIGRSVTTKRDGSLES